MASWSTRWIQSPGISLGEGPARTEKSNLYYKQLVPENVDSR